MMFVPVCMVSILLFVLFFIILYNYLYSLILSSLLGRFIVYVMYFGLFCFSDWMMRTVRFCLRSLLVGLSLLGSSFWDFIYKDFVCYIGYYF